MEIKIPCKTQLDLNKNWLLFLNPILHLREETEIPLLATILTLYIIHKNKDYDDTILYDMLFSEETKEAMRIKLGVSIRSFTKSFRALEIKKMIIDGKLNPRILPKDNKLQFVFEIG